MGPARKVGVLLAASVVLALLSSCSTPLPYFARLEPDGEISLAFCEELREFTAVELRLTMSVVGDESSFEERTVVLTGPRVELAEGSVLLLPSVAEGWRANPDYETADNWTYAEIAFVDSSSTTFLPDGFGRSDLESGEWVQVGRDNGSCDPPA